MVTLENRSSIPFRLRGHSGKDNVSYRNFKLIPPFEDFKYSCTDIVYKKPFTAESFTMSFDIENFYTAPGKHLNYTIEVADF